MKRGLLAIVIGGFILSFSLRGYINKAQAYEEIEIKDGGWIVGKVTYLGDPPTPKELEITKDKELCAKEPKLSEDLIVSPSKGIKNTVVSIVDIEKGKAMASSEPAPQIDQRGCVFRPHVLLVYPNDKIEVLNSDGILHNFHSYSFENPPINRAQPKFKKKMDVSYELPETIKVQCDAHGWMNTWIIVKDSPYYALTDEEGSFKIPDVPPGNYKLKVWHESLGEQSKDITVKAKAETKADFELQRK